LIGMVWFTVTQAKTTLVEHISTTINEDPTISRFDNESQKKVASLPILVLDSRSRFSDLSFHSQLCLGLSLTSTFYYVYLLLENKWAKVKRKDPDLKDQNPYRQRFRP
jgi:hypothetical protein